MKQVQLSKDLTDQCIYDYLALLDSPRSLAVWLLYMEKEHEQLIALDSPFEMWDHTGGISLVRTNHAATKLLQKSDFLSLGIDTREVAVESGRQSEAKNKITNQFLRDLRNCRICDYELNAVLHRAARIVSSVLGRLDRALERMYDTAWTPGRTSSCKSPFLHPLFKYQATPDSSSGALIYAKALLRGAPLWSSAVVGAEGYASVIHFPQVDHNTATTVPKNAKTDRLICFEPHMNIRLQRSVGVWMADQIRRKTGIDLQSQFRNQVSARDGSIDGVIATIDLSAASDTICSELVYDLLAPDWYEFLNDLRSRFTKWPDGSVTRNEKFSSMGNGFTFELETLIFYAVCKAALELDGSDFDPLVYGDDIILPSRNFDMVSRTLTKCGFSVNAKKSFSSGYFRESCGADWYRGVNLKAPRIERRVKTLTELMKWHNRLSEFAVGGDPVVNRRRKPNHTCLLFIAVPFHRLLSRLRRLARKYSPWLSSYPKSTLTGPFWHGDGHFWVAASESSPRSPHRKQLRSGWCGFEYETIAEVAIPSRSPLKGWFSPLCSALDAKQTSPSFFRKKSCLKVVSCISWMWDEVILV